MARLATWCALSFLIVSTVTATAAQELHVAAASDLTASLPAIAQQFERDAHCKVVISFGSSGNFYQQLQNGAPFDVFLSADLAYPKKLQEAGLTAPGTFSQYAAGKLVLWKSNNSKADLSKGLKGLLDSSVQKIAIGNPQHAPYGKAALAALKAEGIYEQLSAKLVVGENVAQTALFAQSGNADAGLIPLSLALNPTMKNAGRYVDIPSDEYPPIQQAAVVLKNSKNAQLATRFVQFLSSPSAQRVLQQFGFTTK
jgi:molybdate transport system substrate-binding protein